MYNKYDHKITYFVKVCQRVPHKALQYINFEKNSEIITYVFYVLFSLKSFDDVLHTDKSSSDKTQKAHCEQKDVPDESPFEFSTVWPICDSVNNGWSH